MKRGRYGWKGKNRIISMLLMFLMALAMVSSGAMASEADRMPALEADHLCTLKVMMTYTDPNLETDNVKTMSGVEVRLVKVADLAVHGGSADYTLKESYGQTEISFAGMTASQSNEAAKMLAPLVTEADVKKATADSAGKAEFSDLEPGMYLVYQEKGANEAYRVDEIMTMLLAVPFPVKAAGGNSWQYEVSIRPKTELIGPHNNGRIRVIKQLFNSETNLPYNPPENTELVFYVGLFTDEACTQRAAGTTDQPLRFRNSSSAETVFENLETDRTYYIAETDENGTVISSVKKQDVLFAAEYPNGKSVAITQQKPEGEILFRNVTTGLPSGYYYGGKLTITKKTVKDGRDYPMTRTFYAGVFSDKELKERMGDIVELKLENESSASVTLDVSIGTSENDSATYYVAETDQEGNPLKNGSGLEFVISLNKKDGKVTLTPAKPEDEVVITNEFTPGGGGNPPGGGGNPPGGGGSTPPKTGDETPIALYAGLMAAALLLLVLLFLFRRKSRK